MGTKDSNELNINKMHNSSLPLFGQIFLFFRYIFMFHFHCMFSAPQQQHESNRKYILYKKKT